MSITNETKLNQVQTVIARTSKDISNTTSTHPKMPALIEHLKSLFTLEIALLSAGVTESVSVLDTQQLWYPDDSGAWVEVPDSSMEPPTALKPQTIVEILQHQERESREYSHLTEFAAEWYWNVPAKDASRIVAYKIVT